MCYLICPKVNPNRHKIQLLLILATNAMPLAGVEFWKWNAFQIIFLYWLESFVVGIYAVLELGDLDYVQHLFYIPTGFGINLFQSVFKKRTWAG